MKLQQCGNLLSSIFPEKYAESWDNVGWMVYPGNYELTGILVCVDPSPEAIKEANSKNCNLILAHHPLLFESLDQIRHDHPVEGSVLEAIDDGIAIYSAHTNADSMPGGLNDVLADRIGMNDVEPLRPLDEYPDAGLGRVGTLSKNWTIMNVVEYFKEKLDVDHLELLGNPNRSINTIGVCSGSGGDFIDRELANSLDLYVTADVKHHQAELARVTDLSIINLDHYEMESVFLPMATEKLNRNFETTPIKSFRRQNPYTYYCD